MTESEQMARDLLLRAIDDGKAEEIYDTYAFCKQSCDYVYGILRYVADAEFGTVSEDVRNFARNLLDDWSK